MKLIQILILMCTSLTLFNCTSMKPEEESSKQSNKPESQNPEEKSTAEIRDSKSLENISENETVQLSGIVQKVTELEGTLSEYFYYIIRTRKGEVVLFNSKQKSLGFDMYTGTQVDISGLKITGTIGWKRIPKEGIQVENISPGN